MDPDSVSPTYSLVIPVYDEDETLPELFKRLDDLLESLDGDSEVIMVDDGSRDASFSLLVAKSCHDKRYKVVHFSRNFGHQLAITAGIDHATGDAVIVMDSDLQDPPEVILDLAKRWREGYEVVHAVRAQREKETWFKKQTATLFYRLLRKLADIDMPLDAGDFRLVDRKAAEAFRAMREHSRFVRGMFSWVGFSQAQVTYTRAGRFAGRTKYPFAKMLRLAIDALLSFSTVPLRLVLSLGILTSLVSFFFGIMWLVMKLSGAYTVPGWASVVLAVVFLGGVQLVVMGVMGEYLARIYEEVKRRPLYVVHSLHGFHVRQSVSDTSEIV